MKIGERGGREERDKGEKERKEMQGHLSLLLNTYTVGMSGGIIELHSIRERREKGREIEGKRRRTEC